MRVAVAGVPRGGTSAVVGLLRIAGFTLPGSVSEQICAQGESRSHRWEATSVYDLVRRVDRLPDGTVWKDPQVARYAHCIDWSTWRVVRVWRHPDEVGDAEYRWTKQDTLEMRSRAARWNFTLDEEIPGASFAALTHFTAVISNVELVQTELHFVLGLDPPTDAQRLAALDFTVRSGYRCPLPESCEICANTKTSILVE